MVHMFMILSGIQVFGLHFKITNLMKFVLPLLSSPSLASILFFSFFHLFFPFLIQFADSGPRPAFFLLFFWAMVSLPSAGPGFSPLSQMAEVTTGAYCCTLRSWAPLYWKGLIVQSLHQNPLIMGYRAQLRTICSLSYIHIHRENVFSP